VGFWLGWLARQDNDAAGKKLKKMPSVIFICTANICRSPIAEALFRAALGKTQKDWRIESAGTWAPDGEPAAEKAQHILRARGIELSRHRSRSVNRGLLNQFNLILTMERGHKEALRAEFPELAGRTYLLSEMVDQIYDIQDPIGGTQADFQDTINELEHILSSGIEKISGLAKEQSQAGDEA
jgi:protein-tyrosine-phosphatase